MKRGIERHKTQKTKTAHFVKSIENTEEPLKRSSEFSLYIQLTACDNRPK